MKYLILFSIVLIFMNSQNAVGQTTCLSCNGNGTSSATGSNALAAGAGSLSRGAQSVTIGSADTAFLDLGVCVGNNLRDSGIGAILLGTSNCAVAPNSFIAGIHGYAGGSNAYAMGTNDSAIGANSFAFGTFAKTNGFKSFAIGNNIITDSSFSIAIGTSVRSSGTNSIVLGSGINLLQPLRNNINNSLMVGFNSTTPTLYVGPANNHGPASVGIGTTTPQQMLDVNGNIAVSGIAVINNAGFWVGKPVGSKWYTGTTAAPVALGNDSDFYLNTVTDSVFEKLGTWKGIALIKGAQGLQGLPGATTLDTGSVFLGKGATTSGTDAFAIGTGVTANGSGSFVMGSGVSNSTPSSFMLGFGSPLLFAGVIGGAGFVGIGTATPTPGVMLGVSGSVMIGGGAPAAGAMLTVNGNATVTGTTTLTGNISTNGTITVNGTEVIDATGSSPKIVDDAVKDFKKQNAGGDVTGTYSALSVVKIQGKAVATTGPANRQVLQWNGTTNQWTPSTLTIPTYKQGGGVKISGDTIYALLDSPIWNANRLQRNVVSATAPANKQVLQWNSTTKQWTPSTLTIPTYKQGTGVKISGDTVYARVDSPLWNANRLQRNAVSATAPANKQVLQWNSTTKQWTPGNIGWAIDSLRPDSILMYTTTKANIGIGTSQPKALLQVQGGHIASTDSTFIVDKNGNVAIGTTNIDTPYKLSVRGEIRAMGITVESGWADYVFAPGYSLMPLTQVEQYISANGHLPGTLSAKQIAQQGLDVGKTQKMMMEKIEELTLYMIELKKQNQQLTDKLTELQSNIK